MRRQVLDILEGGWHWKCIREDDIYKLYTVWREGGYKKQHLALKTSDLVDVLTYISKYYRRPAQ